MSRAAGLNRGGAKDTRSHRGGTTYAGIRGAAMCTQADPRPTHLAQHFGQLLCSVQDFVCDIRQEPVCQADRQAGRQVGRQVGRQAA